MEPISTNVMISSVVSHLSKTLKENKSLKDFFSDFTDATVDWIRPLFLIDDEIPKEQIQDLHLDPNNKLNLDAIENILAKELHKNPDSLPLLQEMYSKVMEKEGSSFSATHLKAQESIEVKANQQNSTANIFNLESREGKINIDIQQK